MTYDLIVLGAGPAGYIAAERAGVRGLKVLLVERGKLGGVCLNEGCIPSKTLLNSAKMYHHAVHGAAYGVTVKDAAFDLAAVHARKAKVMDALRSGVAGIMKRLHVDVVTGEGRLEPGGKLIVNGDTYQGQNILIATGSAPARPPIPGLDRPSVVDSSGILNVEKLPRNLVVVGGGVIGCELACFFGSVGVPVTVIEMLPEICPSVDPEIARMLRTELGRKNITFRTGARVESIEEEAVRFIQDGQAQQAEADLVLVATGRVPNVDGIGLDRLRVDFDRRGIRIDDRCATNVPGVWAAGDVTGRAWLAHAASRMAEVVVHNITGRRDRMRYHTLPGVIYTSPEVASVGWTEAQAREAGIPVTTGKRPMSANGRFLAEHEGERGLVKVVLHERTRALLGVHILGGACSEMIFGATAMIEMEFRVKEIEELVFPHPTTSELLRDTLIGLD